jgi:hypothetical protein
MHFKWLAMVILVSSAALADDSGSDDALLSSVNWKGFSPELKVGLSSIVNSAPLANIAKHRLGFDFSGGQALGSGTRLELDARYARDAEESRLEFAFLTFKAEPTAWLSLRVRAGTQIYFNVIGQFFRTAASGAETLVMMSETSSQYGFVSGAGLTAKIVRLAPQAYLFVGSPPNSSKNWDLVVNRMDGTNNTASFLVPIGIEYRNGAFRSIAAIGYRTLVGGSYRQGHYAFPYGFHAGYSISESSELGLGLEIPNVRATPSEDFDGTNSRRVYDYFDQTAQISLGIQI